MPNPAPATDISPETLAADRLTKAARAGNVAVVAALLDQGVNINSKDKDGNIALIAAIMAEPSDKQINMVRLLIKRGADLEGKSSHASNTALTLAAFYGRTTVVRLLINAGADLEARNKSGYAAQDLAAMNDRFEVVRMIRDAIVSRHQAAAAEEKAKLVAAENARHEMVADKQESLKKHAPRRLKIPAGPSP